MLNVRVIELPARPIALFKDYEKLPDELKKANDAFYPSKFSRFNAPKRDFEKFMLLPDNFTADPSFTVGELADGLYAVGLMQGDGKWGMMADIGSLYKWINENGFAYREDVEMFRNDLPSKGDYPPVTEMYFPVMQEDEHNPVVYTSNADEILSAIKVKESHKIDLNTMVCEGTTLSRIGENGELILHEPGHDGHVRTKDKYSFPLMVKLRARTDSTNLRFYYAKAGFIFNWETAVNNPFGTDINGKDFFVKDLYLPARIDADIVFILEREYMAIIVDGNIKYHQTGMNTDGASDSPEHVTISAAWGSIVTVSELGVCELE